MMVMLLIYAIYTSLSRQRLRKADAKINIFPELPKGQALNVLLNFGIFPVSVYFDKFYQSFHGIFGWDIFFYQVFLFI